MTTACVIPARLHSTRFPAKLLAQVQGKTVLQRTLEQAKQCRDLDMLFVATDDERIAQHVRHLGSEVIWTSPSCQNGTERVAEALHKEPRLQKSAYIVNVQGDHPCTKPATMSAIIQALKQDPKASLATAAIPIQDQKDYLSPHVVKCVVDLQGYALYFSRSPIPYAVSKEPPHAYAHIGIYCYRTPFLASLLQIPSSPLQRSEDLEQLKVLENRHLIKVVITQENPLGVDTPEDLVKLEALLCQQSNTFS